MTHPEDPPVERRWPEVEPNEPAPAEPVDAPAEPVDVEGTPAWADPETFADMSEEPAYDEWTLAQDLDRLVEGTAEEPTPEEPEPVPLEEPAAADEEALSAFTAGLASAQEASPLADGPLTASDLEPEPTPDEALEPTDEQSEVAAQADEPAVPVEASIPVQEPAVAAEETAPRSERPATGVLAVLVVLAVLLSALTAFLAVESSRSRGGGPTERGRLAALDAARSSARLVFSYDYRHLTEDFAKGKAVTTGAFQQEYTRTTAQLVNDVAPRYKAVVQADVSDAAVVGTGHNQVVVLLFVDQQSSSTLSASPKITQSRLEMTMVQRHGRWLVAKIKAF